jgi:hypothetical protein
LALTTICLACPIVSAKTVAQNPSRTVIPPLSPAQPTDEAVDDALPTLSADPLSDFTQAASVKAVAIAANEYAAILFIP